MSGFPKRNSGNAASQNGPTGMAAVNGNGGAGEKMRFRLMSWNVLAQGLVDDGFVLARTGESTEALCERLHITALVGKKVREAHKQAEPSRGKFKPDAGFAKEVVMDWADAPSVLKEDWDGHLAKEKQDLMDLSNWASRGPRIVDEIVRERPDVVVLHECDKYDFFCEALAVHGYTSSASGSTEAYNSLKTERLKQDADYCASLQDLVRAGLAFAPRRDSPARRFATKAAAMAGDTSCVPDDDGTAVFWRHDTFKVVGITVCAFDDKVDTAAIKVRLAKEGSGHEVDILGFHLPSGPEKENRRHMCLRELLGWYRETSIATAGAQQGDVALVLAADLNSDVWFDHEVGDGTCSHRILTEEWGLQSMWQDQVALPASVLKMRGVASNQPTKWGELMVETIDYIASSTGKLTFDSSCDDYPKWTKEERERVRSMEDQEAISRYLIPSASVPSDHRPVVALVEL